MVPASNQQEIVTSVSEDIGGIMDLDGRSDTDVNPTLPPTTNTTFSYFTQILGGARIKKVSHYSDNNKKETEKEYFYTDSINGILSSGILYQSRPCIGTINGHKVYVIEDTWNKNYNIDECPIGYSSVFERNLDGSYCRYKFSNYHNNPDGEEINVKRYPNTTFNNLALVSSSQNRVTSNAEKRGLLTEKYSYNSNGNEVQYERIDYHDVSLGTNFITDPSGSEQYTATTTDYIVSFKSMQGGCIARKIYLQSHPMTYKQAIRDNITQEERYCYNHYDLLQTKSVILKPADTLTINYTYPFDYTTSVYTQMVTENILSPVIEQVTNRIQGSTSKEIERIKTDYIKDATRTKNLFLPDKTGSSHSGVGNLRTDITYDLYDEKGNVLQMTGKDDIPITYLWGYNYQYPIAEIKNATYDQSQTTLPANAQKTTFTYKPLVGIETVTNPRGVITYYNYDALGRLQNIMDHNGKKIENYDYHYKNQ